MLAEPRRPWPSHVTVVPRRPEPLGDAAAMLSFVGHSTFLIQTRLGNILTDPMYSDRASPVQFVGPHRVRKPAVPFDALPPISVVLLSHNHYDHCDATTLRAIEARWRPLVVTPLGNTALLRSFGLTRVEELDWWAESRLAPMPVVLVPARHFSARTPFDRNRALWGGFAVALGRRRILFAGDTAYGTHFREIRERLGAPDLALLPIGAYEPRWFMREVHMDPAEAVQAHLDLGAVHSAGMHFGTFRLTAEGIDDPVLALRASLDRRALERDRFRVPEFGESFPLDD
jgi:L-ascorbate metabolism protein UlaG (beta-lactamase superfamily)